MPSTARNWMWKKQARSSKSIEAPSISTPMSNDNYIEEDIYLIPSYAKSWDSNEEAQTFGDFERLRARHSSEEKDAESREGECEYYAPTPSYAPTSSYAPTLSYSQSRSYEENSYHVEPLPVVETKDEDEDQDDKAQAFGSDNGITVIDLVDDFSTGRVWEGGASPLDFVNAIATGAVISDIFPASTESQEASSNGNRSCSMYDDEHRVPVEERSEESQAQPQDDGAGVYTFVNDVSTGKMWEDGTSPVDFVHACASGEVLEDVSDYFSAGENTSTEREVQEKKTAPVVSSWFAKLEDFLLGGDCNPTPKTIPPQLVEEPVQEVQEEEKQRPSTTSRGRRGLSPERRRRADGNIERVPGRPRQKTIVREVGRSSTARGRRLASPTRTMRVVRDLSPDKRGGRLVSVERSNSRSRGSRKSSSTSKISSTQTKKSFSPMRRRQSRGEQHLG